MNKKRRHNTKEPIINRNHLLIGLLFILLSTTIVYLNCLNGPWAMDDIVINRPLNFEDISSMAGFRSISLLSFKINQSIGGFNPLSFRIFNLVIHIINSFLLFTLIYLSLKKWKLKQEHLFLIPLLTSVIFALHPLNINAVAYIVQRMAMLSTMFVLLSILIYRQAVIHKNLYIKTLYYSLSLFLIILGILSKENAIMAPFLLLLYDLYFITPIYGTKKDFYKRLTVIGGLLVGAFLISLFILRFEKQLINLFNLIIKHFNEPIENYPWTASDVYWSPKEHILTELRVLCRYIFLIFLPLPDFLVFDYWGYTVSKGLLTPPSTSISLFIIIAILLFSFLFRKKYPFIFFGILWYFISISLESFIAVGSDLYFEHRNYLPLTGLLIGLSLTIIPKVLKRPTYSKAWTITLIISISLGFVTFYRTSIYRDSTALWTDTIKKAPNNLRALVALGNIYLSNADFERASFYYKKAIKKGYKTKRAGYFSAAAYSLGMIYLFSGNTEKAKGVLNILKESTGQTFQYNILKGYYLLKIGNIEESIKILKKLLRNSDKYSYPIICNLLGDAYREKGLFHEAKRYYKKTLKVEPKMSAAYYGLAQISLKKRNIQEAETLLKKALEYNAQNPLVLADLSDIMLLKGDINEALRLANESLSHNPPFSTPYLNMGNLLTYLGRESEADEYYNIALQKGASTNSIIYGKARALYLKGEKERASKLMNQLK